MNKKLLFGVMSLAALAACTNDDFDSQQQVAEGTSPIQFEVINNNATMRAYMDDKNSLNWEASKGDLFTLYHGGTLTGGTPDKITNASVQNATYKAVSGAAGQPATLTTPSMILPGKAIMVWPVDTIFRTGVNGNLSIKIPTEQTDIANHIPYVSDLITIGTYSPYTETAPRTDYNTAGYVRKYPVYMRPMASQLILRADYAGTDLTLKTLEGGEDGIDPIELTSVDLLTTTGGGTTPFTKEIDLTFTDPISPVGDNWGTVPNNAWTKVTGFDNSTTGIKSGITANDGQTDKLTSKCLDDNKTKFAKFLILPQAAPTTGVADAAVVVNTTYGKVVVAANGVHGSQYVSGTEDAAPWYRVTTSAVPAATATANNETAATTAEASGEHAGKYITKASVAYGMQQVIKAFNDNTAPTSSKVRGESTGAVGTRYVKVLLTHLDMSDLHVESDKQLRDVVRVWETMGLPSVTVYLDGGKKGDAAGEFTISQQTIAKINEINARATGGKSFSVKPCHVTGTGEACDKIVVTGNGAIKDLAFIKYNDVNRNSTFDAGTDVKADVVLKAGEEWTWATNKVDSKNAFKVDATATGINSIINKGTLKSNEKATLAIYDNATTPAQVTTIPFYNDGTWNIDGATIFVQFDVENYGKVEIADDAQYREDGTGNIFKNRANTLPERFLAAGVKEEIGLVWNEGVFATVNGGEIYNYGLIEHAADNAKTYITRNQTVGASFASSFASHKMGRINLEYSNKDEDNISISAAANQGFVSVTIKDGDVTGTTLNTSAAGTFVNYIIVKGGITEIAALPEQIKYVEFDQKGTEIKWSIAEAGYEGLIVLSDVNIKLGTKVASKVTYLGADAQMYVGGTFNKDAAVNIGTPPVSYPVTKWTGFYGNTTANVATNYVTYK